MCRSIAADLVGVPSGHPEAAGRRSIASGADPGCPQTVILGAPVCWSNSAEAMNVHGKPKMDAPARPQCSPRSSTRTLLAVIPGCREIEQVGDEYRGPIALRLPGVVGTYRTVVRLVDTDAPRTGGWRATSTGALGTIRGRAHVPPRRGGRRDGGRVRGPAAIDGPLARLDGRFVEGLAARSIARAWATWRLAASGRLPRTRAGVRATDGGSDMTVRAYLLPRLAARGARPARDHGPDVLVIAGGTVAMPLINDGSRCRRR